MDPFYYSDNENTNTEAFKAVDIAQGDLFDLFGTDPTSFKNQKNSWNIREEGQEVKVVETLETMVRYIWLVSLDPIDSFNSVVEALKLTGYNHHQTNQQEKCIYGFLFSGPRYTEYRLDLFKYEGRMGVECVRLSGCSFLLGELQDALEKELRQAGYMKFEDESDTESDFEIEFSDDEDVDFSLAPTLSPSSNFLDLSEDGEYVETLIGDIQNPSFQVDSLLTVAHNACEAENMKAFQAYDTQLFSACVACLAAAGCSLAIVRSAVLIIVQLLKNDTNKTLKVTEEQYTVIAATLLAWLNGNESDRTVTVSEEVVNLISQQLQTLNKRAKQTEECKHILSKVYSEAKSMELRDSINGVISAY